MSRTQTWLHREVVRHLLSVVIALAVAGLILGLVRLGRGSVPSETTVAGLITLMFGTYGPAYLCLSYRAFSGVHGEALRSRVLHSAEPSPIVRILFIGGPKSWALLIVGVGIISVVLMATRGDGNPLMVFSCVLGVAGAWVLLVAVFAIEHMRGWAAYEGFGFPGSTERRFSDFVYLSVQLATTFSTSDVTVNTPSARGLVTVQSIVAFAYNAVVIAVFSSLLVTLAR